MPEVHLPHLDDHADHTTHPPAAPKKRGASLFKLALEVVLISAGVFLGLAGEQFRERRHEHELARAAIRRFHTEVTANRAAVAATDGYHATLKSDLSAWLSAAPAARKDVVLHMERSLAPVFFEHSAWDLALATQSLAYIDEDLAFELSRLYTAQQTVTQMQTGIMQTTIYTRSPATDPEGYFRSLNAFLGDLSYFEPVLMKAYDDVLPKLEAAAKD